MQASLPVNATLVRSTALVTSVFCIGQAAAGPAYIRINYRLAFFLAGLRSRTLAAAGFFFSASTNAPSSIRIIAGLARFLALKVNTPGTRHPITGIIAQRLKLERQFSQGLEGAHWYGDPNSFITRHHFNGGHLAVLGNSARAHIVREKLRSFFVHFDAGYEEER